MKHFAHITFLIAILATGCATTDQKKSSVVAPERAVGLAHHYIAQGECSHLGEFTKNGLVLDTIFYSTNPGTIEPSRRKGITLIQISFIIKKEATANQETGTESGKLLVISLEPNGDFHGSNIGSYSGKSIGIY